MDCEHTIRTLIHVSNLTDDTQSSKLATNIINHIEEHGGNMITKNMLDVSSIIKVAYASEMTTIGIPFAYGKVMDLYNWMLETRGVNYVIELQSNIASLPEHFLRVYSDVLPHVNGFLDIQLAISGSKLTVTRVQD